jgi:hypothetical protein
MSYSPISGMLIHRCTIRRSTSVLNDEGEEASTTNVDTTNVKCRIFMANAKIGGIRQFNSGDHAILEPTVLLLPTTDIKEGDFVVSTVSGYSKTYRVDKVYTIYKGSSTDISHKKANLTTDVPT